MFEIQRNEYELHLFLIILVSTLLSYEYCVTSRSNNESTHSINALLPYNNSVINTADVYDQLMDIEDFTFLMNPQPCLDYSAGLLLMIIVSSKPSNFANRMVIRKTWGKTADSTKVIFLLGETDNITLWKQIENESNLYGDIAQGNFMDTYRNLTYKHVMGLKWVVHHCPVAKYILKSDDDTVVNIQELWRFLGVLMSPFGMEGVIMCHTYSKAAVMRHEKAKWKVSAEEYKEDFYPPYCAGWAILYSQEVVYQLLEAAQSTNYFWIDDVYVTGICAKKIGTVPIPLASAIVTDGSKFVKLGAKAFGKFIFGPPNLSSEDMLKAWNSLPQSPEF